MVKPFETLEVDESGGIHTICLNRPERRNALNPQMTAELGSALELSDHCSCGVVILTGAGSAFCSGMDLEHLRSLQQERPEDQRADAEAFASLIRRLYELDKPTIGAVNGPALAGGAGLALLCDFTLASSSAKFGFTEVKVGFIPAVVSVFLLAIVGEKRTRELLLSGRILSAAEALSLGLVSEVSDELIPRARELAASLMKNSPASMREVKRMLNGFSKRRLDSHLQWAVRWSERVRNNDDFREGIRAFFEKREPQWAPRNRH